MAVRGTVLGLMGAAVGVGFVVARGTRPTVGAGILLAVVAMGILFELVVLLVLRVMGDSRSHDVGEYVDPCQMAFPHAMSSSNPAR
jgi:hypothetical protein